LQIHQIYTHIRRKLGVPAWTEPNADISLAT
jgi:hypothetical protein